MGPARGGVTVLGVSRFDIANPADGLAAFTALRLTVRCVGPVPNSADFDAGALEVTALNDTSKGHLRIYPSDEQLPSNVNYQTPAVAVESLTIVKLSSKETIMFLDVEPPSHEAPAPAPTPDSISSYSAGFNGSNYTPGFDENPSTRLRGLRHAVLHGG